MEEQTELKPCPFCGSHDVFINFPDSEHIFWGQCEDCDCETGWKDTEELAIKAWNTRINKEG